MKITNEFTVQIPVDQAWMVLTDLEGIAPCMPGAQLTGVEGEVYRGKVKVKVGPVISEFAGTAQFTAKDDSAYRAVIDAKGRDARSAGNASATVSASLTPEGATATRVSVDTDLRISGKLAQFGSGMIKEVSAKLLAQFVANLEAKLAADTADTADTAAPTSTVSEAAVATAPDSAVALGAVAPAAPGNGDDVAPAIVPDPSAGEVEAAAGRLETAEGTPEPVAGLRVPGADLSAAGPAPSTAPTAAAADSAAADSAAAAPAPAASAPAVASASADSAPAATSASADSAPATRGRSLQTEEPEAIDLLAVAGSSIYKRIVPVAVGAVVVAAVIVWFVARG